MNKPRASKVIFLLLGGLLLAAPSHAFIVIGPGDPPCFVDPTQPRCRQPVLIVPGLGASYNKKLMLKDQASDKWKFAPSVDWFDSLITRLENEGYEQNKDLFIVHYDWRQPNLYSAIQYLIPAINRAKLTSGGEKVDIIAHSMGGLVARAYAQSENLYNSDIDQLIFLGTPNSGAAGAYIPWEGGQFPQTWGPGSKLWMLRIERALRKTRSQELARPLSFRAFFPSLKDLLPINNYITKDGNAIAAGDLTEQNEFLQNLASTEYRLDEREIEVHTIAGNQLQTLASIPLNQARTPQDVNLQRWRDGHANPDPPQPNSTQGDQTVLTESVQSITTNSNIVLDNIKHEELPGQSQNHLAQLLTQNPQADFVPSTLAQAAVGVDILSPAIPIITGPNGAILSPDLNTFPNADYDWDQTDPADTIKVLTIADPPDGEYTVRVTGLEQSPPPLAARLFPFAQAADNEYSIIISYADQDDTQFFEQTQPAEPGQVDTYRFTINQGQFQTAAEVNIKDLLRQIIALAKQARKECPLKGYQRASLTRPATHAINDFRLYESRLKHNRPSAAASRLASFNAHLQEIAAALSRLTNTANCPAVIRPMQDILQQITTKSLSDNLLS